MHIYFVVLHYQRMDVTKCCLLSLLSLAAYKGCSVDIVVVDNASNNGSLEKLKSFFAEFENIVWIESKENLGFARGNNLGFKYIKNQNNADAAVFLNNDTEIVQENFLEKLSEKISNSHFDVLSVDIYDPYADQHQSPLCDGDSIKEYAIKEIQYADKILNAGFFEKLFIDAKDLAVRKLFRFQWFRAVLHNRICAMSKSANWTKKQYDVVPHGSCVIFGARYIKESEFAFYPGTNMYFEECILKVLCDKRGFIVQYSPEIQVLHHHHQFDESSLGKFSYGQLKKKALNEKASYKEFIKVLNDFTI